ncbi:MAG: hypothetical protein Q9194_007168 [Teloschistes cf. exilis]
MPAAASSAIVVLLICDYEKGGKTCTAAALHTSDAGLILWLTVNPSSMSHKRCPPEIHVAKVFDMVKKLPSASNLAVPDAIVNIIQRQSASRLDFYRKQAYEACKQCRRDLVDFKDEFHAQQTLLRNEEEPNPLKGTGDLKSFVSKTLPASEVGDYYSAARLSSFASGHNANVEEYIRSFLENTKTRKPPKPMQNLHCSISFWRIKRRSLLVIDTSDAAKPHATAVRAMWSRWKMKKEWNYAEDMTISTSGGDLQSQFISRTKQYYEGMSQSWTDFYRTFSWPFETKYMTMY